MFSKEAGGLQERGYSEVRGAATAGLGVSDGGLDTLGCRDGVRAHTCARRGACVCVCAGVRNVGITGHMKPAQSQDLALPRHPQVGLTTEYSYSR